MFNLMAKLTKIPGISKLTTGTKNVITTLNSRVDLYQDKINDKISGAKEIVSEKVDEAKEYWAVKIEDTKAKVSDTKELVADNRVINWLEEDAGRYARERMEQITSWSKNAVGKLSETGAEIKEGTTSILEKLEGVAASGAVVATSITSGVLKIGEYAVDGVIWLGGMAAVGATSIYDKVNETEYAKEVKEGVMDTIAYDAVGNLNKGFYEKTEVGKRINEASYLKYDSTGAQTIQKVSKYVGEFAIATAVTVATGGAASVLIVGGIGFLEGSGEKLNESYSKEDRDFWKGSASGAISGVGTALEWIAMGKTGAGVVHAVSAIPKLGIKEFGKGIINSFRGLNFKSVFTKDFAKAALKNTLKDFDIYADTLGIVADNVSNEYADYLETGKLDITKSEVFSAIWEIAFSFGANLFSSVQTLGIEKIESIPKYAEEIRAGLYDDGIDVAKQFEMLFGENNAFRAYENHNFEHVARVADKTDEVAHALQRVLTQNYTQGYSKNIDFSELEFCSLWHDTGMSGGALFKEDGSILSLNGYSTFVDDDGNIIVKKLDEIRAELISEIKEFKIVDAVRGNHALNSAVEILKNRDIISAVGQNPDRIALLVFSHSKSCSGISDLIDKGQWSLAINQLMAVAEASNGEVKFDLSSIVELDTSGNPIINDIDVLLAKRNTTIKTSGYTFKSDIGEQLASESLALRIGDSHADKTHYSQAGGELVKKVLDESKIRTGDIDDELASTAVNSITDTESLPVDGFSKKFILGEQNLSSNNSVDEDGILTHYIRVKTDEYPASTWQMGIVEKLGEYKTGVGLRQRVVIELPESVMNYGDVDKVYKDGIELVKSNVLNCPNLELVIKYYGG